MRGGALLVADYVSEFLRRVRWAVAKQTVQQKHIEKADRGGCDRNGHEGVEVHEPYFDVLDAAITQRMQRALTRPYDTLWPDGAVELVFDLQQARCKLPVLIPIADSNRLIGR